MPLWIDRLWRVYSQEAANWPGVATVGKPGQPRWFPDRRDRGIRGMLAPRAIPISRSRSEAFDYEVIQAVERLQRALPELVAVEVAVDEVPPAARRDGSPDPVPLGRIERARAGVAARLTLHRRPIELRSAPGVERNDLIADTIAELVAELFGLAPRDVDPDYDG